MKWCFVELSIVITADKITFIRSYIFTYMRNEHIYIVQCTEMSSYTFTFRKSLKLYGTRNIIAASMLQR